MSDADLFERAFNSLAEAKSFGLPIKEYKSFGSFADAGAARDHDFICISECRHCGHLNTTLAQEEDGLLIPMSAGRGPLCKGEKCGDKISASCYGFFRIR
mgnify:CR=1 FL=1